MDETDAELSSWAENELRDARLKSESEYFSQEEVRKKILEK